MKKIFKHAKFTAVVIDAGGYFSITGDMGGASGAVGEEIAAIDPRFAPIARMHLSDCKTGAPMHAWANAEYYAKEGRLAMLARHLRISLDEAKAFGGFAAPGLAEFKAGLETRWRAEAAAVYAVIACIPGDLTRGFVDPYDAEGGCISPEYEICLDLFDAPHKAIAAAMQEDCAVCDVEESDNEYMVAGRTYAVLTDSEADNAWNDRLDSYIAECLEIPAHVEPYFDRDAWKRYAKMDGRGHSLAGYDGIEEKREVAGVTYYLYRQ